VILLNLFCLLVLIAYINFLRKAFDLENDTSYKRAKKKCENYNSQERDRNIAAVVSVVTSKD